MRTKFLPHTGLRISLQFISLALFTVMGYAQTRPPVYSPNISDIETLKKSLEPMMMMSLEEIIAEVPIGSGMYFIGCPSCKGGAQDGGVLDWKPGLGDKVQCNFCSMIFPNEKFPNNREKVIIAPSGAKQVYRYYENEEGKHYYFESHAWYGRWEWLNPVAEQLARAWYATKDNAYGDRAAVIAGRFAQLFPDYAIRYDHPSSNKKFFPANQKWPYEGLTPYRGAKWRWWGYDDIPTNLTNVYDILKSGYGWKRMDKYFGPATDKRIAKDLLRMGYEFVAANPETNGNKDPAMYSQMIRVGRVLGDPVIVHDAVERFRNFLSLGFFADGWWKEGTVSYHDMTMGGLRSVTNAIKGYSDPQDWKGERFDNLDLTSQLPLYQKAVQVSRTAVFPNGRAIPINDTWARTDKQSSSSLKTDRTESKLWASLGNAAIGTGEGENQIMLNMNWSGNYGHSHSDNAAIILYAAGQELLSDIGYTHGKYRPWANHTASHNTVVINQREQGRSDGKPVTGQLKFYDDKNAHVKVIDVDASPAYEIAKTYRRRIIMVNAAPERDYIIDRFDVRGGQDHDWFLHGMCEQEGTLEISLALNGSPASLVPAWGGKEVPKMYNHTDPKRYHPYVFLRDLKSGVATGKPWTATWTYQGNVGLRTHNLSQAGIQVFRFRSPSIRPAGEDNNKLDDYMHGGIMLRNSGKPSAFLTVHEPFRNEPWIESVRQDGETLVVRYKLNGSAVEDRINMHDEQITVSSSAGWKYNSGTSRSGKVEGIQSLGGQFTLRLDQDAPAVNYIRLDLADGETRYCQVASVQGKSVVLADDPGFRIEPDGKVVFHTFPHDQYPGPLRYTLFAP